MRHKDRENGKYFSKFLRWYTTKPSQIMAGIFQSVMYLASSMKICMSLTNKRLRKQQNVNIFHEIVCIVEVWCLIQWKDTIEKNMNPTCDQLWRSIAISNPMYMNLHRSTTNSSSRVVYICKLNYSLSYTKASASDERRWKKRAVKRWESSDKFENVYLFITWK